MRTAAKRRRPSPAPVDLHQWQINVVHAAWQEGYVEECQRCGVNLYPSPPKPLGFFMLDPRLWNVVSLDGKIKCFCLDCTEAVLGGARIPSGMFQVELMELTRTLLTDDLQDRLNPDTDSDDALMGLELDDRRLAIARREFPDLED